MQIITKIYITGSFDDALSLYKRAFGCTEKNVIYYCDAVKYGWESPNAELNDKLYHSEIMFGNQEVRLNVIDDSENAENMLERNISLQFDTEEEVRNAFAILAEEGLIIQDLECPPYMVIIGKVRDKFGNTWELMCDY